MESWANGELRKWRVEQKDRWANGQVNKQMNEDCLGWV